MKTALKTTLASAALLAVAATAATSSAGMYSPLPAVCTVLSSETYCQGTLPGWKASSDPSAFAVFYEDQISTTYMYFMAEYNGSYYGCYSTNAQAVSMNIGPNDGFHVYYTQNGGPCTGLEIDRSSENQ